MFQFIKALIKDKKVIGLLMKTENRTWVFIKGCSYIKQSIYYII